MKIEIPPHSLEAERAVLRARNGTTKERTMKKEQAVTDAIYRCSGCATIYQEAPPSLRECSKDDCGSTFVAVDGNNCPDCNNPFTRNVAEWGCEECQEGVEEIEGYACDNEKCEHDGVHEEQADALSCGGSLQRHPVAALFPPLPDDEYAALKEDIRAHGVRVPILVYEGQILDGWHRYRICLELGIDPPTVEWDGKGTEWLAAKSLNLARRHLSAQQRAAIYKVAEDTLPELKTAVEQVRAEARQAKAHGETAPGRKRQRSGSRGLKRTDAKRAALAGTSPSTLKRVDKLEREDAEAVRRLAAGATKPKRKKKDLTPWRALSGKITPQAVGRAVMKTLPTLRKAEQMVRTITEAVEQLEEEKSGNPLLEIYCLNVNVSQFFSLGRSLARSFERMGAPAECFEPGATATEKQQLHRGQTKTGEKK